VGQQTGEVVDSVIALIQAQTVRDGMLFGQDGKPFTVGDVKAHIRLELARRNLDEAHENIFCPGRDGAIGHNTGQYEMPLRLGESIVFDIFPRDRATGYFHDLTRTFFLGYAPEALAHRWQQVKTVFDLVLERMKVGEPCRAYQDLTCDFFEDLGYPTTRADAKTQRGYTHSLGHGVGLDIHEPPSLNLMPDNATLLQPGHVVSVEPGLYDADEGWGIRIEDTIAFDEEGKLINLSNYRYEMVIPMG
jgi:Xaa-Pro aminopeptidase